MGSSFLRLGVKGGGCSGYSYVLQFDTTAREDDAVVGRADGIEVRVDPKSSTFLEGMVLDFSEGLGGKGFEFVNPNAKSSCGCGQSFGA